MRLADLARRGRAHGQADHQPGREWVIAIAPRLAHLSPRVGFQRRPVRVYAWSYRQGYEAAQAAQPTTKE